MTSTSTPAARPRHSVARAPRLGADRRTLLGLVFVTGVLLMPVGLVTVLLGWWGAARTPYAQDQWSYLISGGMLGLGLMFLGGMLCLGAWLAALTTSRQDRRRDLKDRIAALGALVEQVAPTAPLVAATDHGAFAVGRASAADSGAQPAPAPDDVVIVPPAAEGGVMVMAGGSGPPLPGLVDTDGGSDGGGGRRPRRRRRVDITRRDVGLILLLALTAELVAFEITLVNPGLPEIADAFNISAVHWVLTVLFVVSAATVPVTGRISDVWGKKRTLLACLVIYVAGSALCAVTTSYPLFLAGRGMQAIMLAGPAIAFALVRDLLKPELVPLAVGGILAGSGMSAIVGPVLGGIFVQLVGYQAPFWFLAGYGAVLLVLMAKLMREGRREADRLDLDWKSVGLLTAATVLVTVGLELPVWLLIPAVVLGLAGYRSFVRRCLGQDDPLIDVRLMTTPAMRSTLLVGACGGTFMSSMPFLFPSLLRPEPIDGVAGLGLTPIQMGLLVGLPLGIANCVAAFTGGVVSRRRNPRLVVQLGMGCMMASGFVYCALVLGAPAGIVSLSGALTGLGIGFFLSGTAILVVEAVPAEKHGSSAGVKYTWEAICGAIGIALVAAVMRPGLVFGAGGGGEGEGASAYGPVALLSGYVLVTAVAAAGLWLATVMQHGRASAAGGGGAAAH